jgi:hypothetical protein
MANQILDSRILIDSSDSTTGWIDLGGGTPTSDTEVFIQGVASNGLNSLSNTLDGVVYNAGSAQDWSNNIFYIWINSTIVPFLNLKASGGFRIRFAGAGGQDTDYFEVYVGGKDSWPPAINGGWVQFVVDIEEAAANPSNTGGTPPATTAIQYVGWAGITDGTMPRMVTNVWIDAIWRLPKGNAGIIIEGQNGGTTPWTSEDIFTELGTSPGTFLPSAGGAYKINTPVQFGQTASVNTVFEDTNKVWLWDDQEYLADDFYSLIMTGSSGGSTEVRIGITGSAVDNRTGAQGFVIAANQTASAARWNIDADDPNVDLTGLYGSLFIHGQDFQFDSDGVEVIGNTLLDCTAATGSNGSDFIRNTIVAANTADGPPAFMQVTSITDIKFSTFNFSDGHAVQLVSPLTASQFSKGNIFTGYGANDTTDAAVISLQPGNPITASITDGGSVFSVSRSVDLKAAASFTYTVTDAVSGSEIRLVSTSGEFLPGTSGIESNPPDTDFVYAYEYPGYDQDFFVVVHALDYEYYIKQDEVLSNANQSLAVTQVFDRNYDNPD